MKLIYLKYYFQLTLEVQTALKLIYKQITLTCLLLTMPDPIMYQEDAYVVLESDRPEEFMTLTELKTKLQNLLLQPDTIIPREIEQFDSTELQAQHLIDNYFELDIGTDRYLQWYVVRLEK